MKRVLVLMFLLASFQLFAQTKSTKTETVNGKKYYVHIVESGSTLYGIKNVYGVTVQEILDANPGSEEGIRAGQKLLIPVKDNATSGGQSETPATTSLTHTVEPHETLYGISRQYDLSIDELIRANPGAENGIQVGQELKIPGQKKENVQVTAPPKPRIEPTTGTPVFGTLTKDTIIHHTVLDHETLYSISRRYMADMDEIRELNKLNSLNIKPGQVLKIPVKKGNASQPGIREVIGGNGKPVDSMLLFPAKEKYTIGVLLPLFLDRGPGYSETVSNYALEFWMGAKLAIDSLEKMGMKAEIFVHDTKNDSAAIMKVLNSAEAQTYDMIIGPLFPNKIEIVSEWCKKRGIRMICPVAIPSGVLQDNPFVYAMVPSDITLVEGEATYILKNYSKDAIILVKPTSDKDMAMYNAFRKRFADTPYTGVRPKLIEATIDNFTDYIRKGGKTTIVIPATDKATVLKFMSALNKAAFRMGSGAITVFGTKEWIAFDDIKGQYKNKYSFHFSSPNDFNYGYERTKEVLRKYRRAYNTDFTKMSAQGFDVFMYVGNTMLLNKPSRQGVMNCIVMQQVAENSGFENTNCYMIYQEEYELVNAELKKEDAE